MLGWAVTFLIVALIAALLGFGGIALWRRGFTLRAAITGGGAGTSSTFTGTASCTRWTAMPA